MENNSIAFSRPRPKSIRFEDANVVKSRGERYFQSLMTLQPRGQAAEVAVMQKDDHRIIVYFRSSSGYDHCSCILIAFYNKRM